MPLLLYLPDVYSYDLNISSSVDRKRSVIFVILSWNHFVTFLTYSLKHMTLFFLLLMF
jgi:hypothetical protein